MKKLKSGLLVIILLGCMIDVNAFDFYGYVRDIGNNNISGANVTLTEDLMGMPGTPKVFSGLSNTGGFFNVSNVNESVNTYTLTIVEYTGSVATKTNKILPPFPTMMYQHQLVNKTFYLQNATTINITAINGSGNITDFNGMVFDVKYNFPISSFATGQIDEKHVVVPTGKNNYTVMLWTQQSPPRTVTAYGYNATPGSIIPVQMNMSTQLVHLTGYLKDTDGNLINITEYNFTDAVSYFKMGNFVDIDMGIMKGSPEPDIIANITDWAWYNLTLLGGGTPMEYIVTVYANSSSGYYAGFQNFTVGTEDIDDNITIYPLAGNYDESGNVNTSKVLFNVFYDNGTDNVSAGQTFLDIVVNYNGTSIRFTANTNSTGQLKVPLRDDTSATVEIFNDKFPPREFTYTGSQLNSGEINITMDSLNTMKDAEGNIFQDIKIEFYKSSAICDVPGDPPSGCLLFDISNASDPSEGVEVLLLPGDVSIRLKQNSSGIVVHYINVDLLGSGPPDMNSDTSANTTASGSSLTDAWRFGSMGPEVYESIIIGVPYNESKIDEIYGPPPKILIANLYDVQNNWANQWNSTSDPNATNIPSTYPNDYSDFDITWFNSSYGGMPCSKTNTSAKCYIDTVNNMIWLRIAHFSGLGPQIQAYTNLGEIASDRTAYSCYPNCIAYINLTMNNSELIGVQNITVNNTATLSGVTYKIEYKNLSNQQWLYSGENNSVLTDYNLILYNSSDAVNTTHQFRINITLSDPLSTKWNFTLVINGTSYTLDPWLDSINLTSPDDGNITSEARPDFTYTLYSDNYTSQSCTLMINNTAYGTNISVNGTSTTITANSSLSEGGYTWKISCNETGNSETRTLTIDTTPYVNITNPVNDSWQNSNFIINATVIDNNISTVQYRWENPTNNGSWTNMTQGGNYWNATFDVSSIVNGNYTIRINATDGSGNSNTTETVFVKIDDTIPTEPTPLSPANNTVSTDLTPTLDWTTVTETNFDNYTVQVSDDLSFSYVNYTYNTISRTDSNYTADSNWVTNTVWYWRVTAYDKAGNSNTSGVFNYTADTQEPTIYNVSVNATPILGNTSIQISANVSGSAYISMVWASINKPNGNENTTLTLINGLYNGTFTNTSYQGIYNITVYANDTAGNVNSTNVSFTVASCIVNSDCGTNGYIGSNYCYNNDIYRKYRTYTCSNGGTASASCGYSDSDRLIEDCGDSVVIVGPDYCSNNSVVRDVSTVIKGCNPSTVSCYSQSGGQAVDVVEVCDENYTCVNGSCVLGGTTTTTTSTTTTTIETCPLAGDYPPCGDVSLAEVVDFINLWAQDQAALEDVIDLINAWAAG